MTLSKLKSLFKKKQKKETQRLPRKYTNKVAFTDIENNVINVQVREIGDRSFLYVLADNGKTELAFDIDAATLFSAIISDFVENGNLNKVEEIFETEE